MKMTLWSIVQCLIPLRKVQFNVQSLWARANIEIQHETINAGNIAENDTCSFLVISQPVRCVQRTNERLNIYLEIHTRSRFNNPILCLRTHSRVKLGIKPVRQNAHKSMLNVEQLFQFIGMQWPHPHWSCLKWPRIHAAIYSLHSKTQVGKERKNAW